MKKLLNVFVVISAFLLSSCFEDNQEYLDLAEAYLGKFKESDWKSLYDCKNDSFKNTVTYDFYIQDMENTLKEYSLKDYSVISAKIVKSDKSKFAVVEFDFTLELKDEEKSTINMQDIQIWEVKKEKNICRNLGMDDFFTLNSEVDYEEINFTD